MHLIIIDNEEQYEKYCSILLSLDDNKPKDLIYIRTIHVLIHEHCVLRPTYNTDEEDKQLMDALNHSHGIV